MTESFSKSKSMVMHLFKKKLQKVQKISKQVLSEFVLTTQGTNNEQLIYMKKNTYFERLSVCQVSQGYFTYQNNLNLKNGITEDIAKFFQPCCIYQTCLVSNILEKSGELTNSRHIIQQLERLTNSERNCWKMSGEQKIDNPFPRNIIKIMKFYYDHDKMRLVMVTEDFSSYRLLSDYVHLASQKNSIYKLSDSDINKIGVKILEAFTDIRKMQYDLSLRSGRKICLLKYLNPQKDILIHPETLEVRLRNFGFNIDLNNLFNEYSTDLNSTDFIYRYPGKDRHTEMQMDDENPKNNDSKEGLNDSDLHWLFCLVINRLKTGKFLDNICVVGRGNLEELRQILLRNQQQMIKNVGNLKIEQSQTSNIFSFLQIEQKNINNLNRVQIKQEQEGWLMNRNLNEFVSQYEKMKKGFVEIVHVQVDYRNKDQKKEQYHSKIQHKNNIKLGKRLIRTIFNTTLIKKDHHFCIQQQFDKLQQQVQTTISPLLQTQNFLLHYLSNRPSKLGNKRLSIVNFELEIRKITFSLLLEVRKRCQILMFGEKDSLFNLIEKLNDEIKVPERVNRRTKGLKTNSRKTLLEIKQRMLVRKQYLLDLLKIKNQQIWTYSQIFNSLNQTELKLSSNLKELGQFYLDSMNEFGKINICPYDEETRYQQALLAIRKSQVYYETINGQFLKSLRRCIKIFNKELQIFKDKNCIEIENFVCHVGKILQTHQISYERIQFSNQFLLNEQVVWF